MQLLIGGKTFDKPVVSVKPYVLLYKGTGTVWFDDISVQEGGVR